MKPERKDEILFTEKYRYVLGPSIDRAANGDWLVTLTVGDGSANDASSQTVSCSLKGRKLRCK